ncbi:ADP-ribosylglycohydrolase family protein [Paenibacillus sp. GSMTC-2017]|uniref:ADP-ribosylglycohydrolase family protein n=1 Tax=Paenibacillus sp. GSMTC-2017 TaxID=2794350 RepID=UPI0018D652C9|nr:ADP-ribosylglycohydrolase family protein [Paenibacillus sp. GSMTC-2017]MBH5318353.1 ADP-ribosylglycohydrolase family protein [Paenibacillus sp. GSMTC-2017]
MIPSNYLEKVYSGYLGMNIGIRLGAPVEPTIWTYERIKSTYGEITDYVKEFKNFAADDDANGPYYFLRALYDDAEDRDITPNDVARAWLNYTREGVGMFWWGGYGTSTEHTAFVNLKKGIEAPQSGSIEQNGIIIAEQIGGQIFIDTWGLINPCNPTKAADFGEAAARVSHDGEGVLGARFFCAAISKAFETSNINDIIEAGLAQIPASSTYAHVARAVLAFHAEHPNDFRACREMLESDWGYDKYKGICHIIPNAGVCVLAMIYGQGDFNKTVEIATMCGWDTDCNAGNVGTVLGVACGVEGIAAKYRKPINDSIVMSGISGYLNILDIPTYAKELTILGYRLAKEECPQEIVDSFKEAEVYFDFDLPGSTHNIRVSDPFFCQVKHSTEQAFKGTGSLEVVFDRMVRGDNCKVFYKPFYTRNDFSDERYSPTFAPRAYSGQTVSMSIYLDQWSGNETMGIAPYIRLANSKKELVQGYIKLVDQQWIKIEFEIPDSEGELIDEVGIVLESYTKFKPKSLGRIFIDEFRIFGKSAYTIDFNKQSVDFGCVTPFAHNHGAWSLIDGAMYLMTAEPSEAYTGNYFSKDYAVTVKMNPQSGDSHLVALRAQGAMRGYHIGLAGKDQVALYVNNFGYTKIASGSFLWNLNEEYEMTASVHGNVITLNINGEQLLQHSDNTWGYGMYGMSTIGAARTYYSDIKVIEI